MIKRFASLVFSSKVGNAHPTVERSRLYRNLAELRAHFQHSLNGAQRGELDMLWHRDFWLAVLHR